MYDEADNPLCLAPVMRDPVRVEIQVWVCNDKVRLNWLLPAEVSFSKSLAAVCSDHRAELWLTLAQISSKLAHCAKQGVFWLKILV